MNSLLHTEICDMLGIRYPIVLAGMGLLVSGPSLAAAVSNAGGFGILGGNRLTPRQMRNIIRRTRELTDKPFGVDLLLPADIPEAVSQLDLQAALPSKHVAFVNKLKNDLGVPDAKAPPYALTREYVRQLIDVILDERIPVLALGLGVPDWVVADAHARETKVIALVGNVRNAVRAKEAGVDIIVAQGYDAGGHTGRVGTFALIPQVVDAVHPTPVLAAGGIADGRGLLAALMLGAVGAWIGTRFVATFEACRESPEVGWYTEKSIEAYKREILAATEEDTTISRIFTGKPARVIRNKIIDIWEKEGPPPLPMPQQGWLVEDLLAGAKMKGDADCMCLLTGQVSGMIKELKSAGQVVDEIVQQATGILRLKVHSLRT